MGPVSMYDWDDCSATKLAAVCEFGNDEVEVTLTVSSEAEPNNNDNYEEFE